MDLLLRPWRHYTDFSGRSRRSEFWLFKIIFWAVLIMLVVIGGGIGAITSDARAGGRGAAGSIVMLLIVAFFVGAIIPHWAVTVRRLHDQGKSGWLVLLTFVPYLGIIATLIFGFLPGDEGENEYGFDPREAEPVAAADLHDVFS